MTSRPLTLSLYRRLKPTATRARCPLKGTQIKLQDDVILSEAKNLLTQPSKQILRVAQNDKFTAYFFLTPLPCEAGEGLGVGA